MEIGVFLLFALLAVTSALVVVVHRNPVYSVMSLVVTLVSTAVLFVMLGAPFLAALQVLVYTGAILVLFLFVIMLLNIERETQRTNGGWFKKLAALISAAIFVAIVGSISLQAYTGRFLEALTPESVAIEPLARELFSTYLLPFEIIGLLLLAAVVGATVLARKQDAVSPEKER
ncbi:MAG: NADH-quinone oxidoreductase subunit J [Acidobacteria bacterium]|nr:MAG: NADH-quinone oxidoreductase subunit J [Acidobacteriota bacterium]